MLFVPALWYVHFFYPGHGYDCLPLIAFLALSLPGALETGRRDQDFYEDSAMSSASGHSGVTGVTSVTSPGQPDAVTRFPVVTKHRRAFSFNRKHDKDKSDMLRVVTRRSLRNRSRNSAPGHAASGAENNNDEKCASCGFTVYNDRVSVKRTTYHVACFKCTK